MYLVINLGLKSIRGIIFNENGEQIFSSSRAIFSKLSENKVEQDVFEWKKMLEDILMEIEGTDSLAEEIEYITSTTSSSCIFGMDDQGTPLTKVMMVSDKRANQEANEIQKELDKTKSNLSCPASSVIPKALWYKKNRPETFQKIKYWLGAGEFINYFFTGEIFTDSLNASKSLHEEDGYNLRILNQFDLPLESLPEVKDIGSTYSITSEVLKKYNLNKNCKYVLTTYDAICAVIGSFNGEDHTACDVSGTVTSVRVLTDQPLIKSDGPILSQKLGQFDKYLIGASNNLGGGIIEWHKQSFFKENDKDVYNKMENYASQVNRGSNGIVFLPYLLGERSPIKIPEASGVFFGINRSSTIKEFTRAVFESSAYVSNHLLQLILDNDIKVDSMAVSGGLARFDLINQIKADVTNKPVKVIENFESTSVGALILLFVSLKKFKNIHDAASNIVRVRKIIIPSKANHEIYSDFFSFFTKLNEALISSYKEHHALKKSVKSYSSETISNL